MEQMKQYAKLTTCSHKKCRHLYEEKSKLRKEGLIAAGWDSSLTVRNPKNRNESLGKKLRRRENEVEKNIALCVDKLCRKELNAIHKKLPSHQRKRAEKYMRNVKKTQKKGNRAKTRKHKGPRRTSTRKNKS